jgi:predicted nucleic acid-binding protein
MEEAVTAPGQPHTFLWDEHYVLCYLRKDDEYTRNRSRFAKGVPAVTVSCLAEVLSTLACRPSAALQIEAYYELLLEEFNVYTNGPSEAVTFAKLFAKVKNDGVSGRTATHLWNAVLCSEPSIRVLSKDREMYNGLLGASQLV